MASASTPTPGRGPRPPQDETTKPGGTQQAPRAEEITVEAERGPHPPQDQA